MVESPITKEYRKREIKVLAWLLLEWLQDPQRKPAHIAFTEGPLRVLALTIEASFVVDARRYRTLRASLSGDGEPPISTLGMPVVSVPLHPEQGYLRRGLDDALDKAAAVIANARKDGMRV